ncbi:MAG TPA: hypothetical protein VKP30_22355, partial [Polyangiaceae bacterium]|nr:hypothetical protein [Polyangiaceae bacterium]
MSARLLSLGCLILLGCSSAPTPVRVSPGLPAANSSAVGEALGSTLRAYSLGKVEPGTYGPVSVSLEAGTLSVWASPRGTERVWHARSVERDGHVASAPVVIGTTGLGLGLVSLSPVTQGLLGLLVYSLQATDQSTTLHAMLLDSSGVPRSKPLDLTATGSTLLWVHASDTSQGPIVFYALARGETADIRAVGLTQDGKIRFVDREVTSGLRAWQVTSAPDGAALAVVRASVPGHAGNVSMVLLDPMANIASGPIELDQSPSAELDLDLTRVGHNYIVAWSDRRHIDARVFIAAVDPAGGLVSAARPAVAPIGEQTLVKLVPPVKGGRAVLVWENASLPSQRRMLSLAEVDAKGHVDSRVMHLACSSRSSTLPEIVTTANGVSALVLDDIDESTGQESQDPVPTYVELGEGLAPRAALPLVLEIGPNQTVLPLLAWGLDCRHGCRATAALDDTPVTIAAIPLSDIAQRPNAAELGRRLVSSNAQTLPQLVRLDSVAEIEPISDLAATPVKDGFLISTLTYFDPAAPLKRLPKPGPDGRTDPWQARIDVRPMNADGEVGAAQTISYRATSLPGLSMAGNPQSAANAMAWSAIDQGQPQVFLSTLGADGKKQLQRMLTHRKGRLDEMAVAPHEDGWFVAWVDERANQLDLYALRTTQALERRGNEQQLTAGLRDASDIAVAVATAQSEAVLVYAVTRGGARRRGAELYTRRASLQDAKPIGNEQRLLELSGTAKFLAATPHPEGFVVSWLDVPIDPGLADQAPSVRWMLLNSRGEAVTQPATLAVGDVIPASLAVACPTRRCRGVMVADVGGRGELQGFT